MKAGPPASIAGRYRRTTPRIRLAAAVVDAPTVQGREPAWWAIPRRLDYLAEHLARHLQAAGRHASLAAVVTDLRWVELRLRRHGPAAIEADLVRTDGPASHMLVAAIRQNGHLLTPLGEPDAVPGGGQRLVSGSNDSTVRVWDAVTGECRHTLAGHTRAVWAVDAAADSERSLPAAGRNRAAVRSRHRPPPGHPPRSHPLGAIDRYTSPISNTGTSTILLEDHVEFVAGRVGRGICRCTIDR